MLSEKIDILGFCLFVVSILLSFTIIYSGSANASYQLITATLATVAMISAVIRLAAHINAKHADDSNNGGVD